MLIKSKIQPKPVEQIVSTEATPEVLTPALEDIDYVIGIQNFSDAVIGFESLQTELTHGSDIAASLEQLEMVLESLKELDLHDAALIEVVGDIAGASCGVPARLFTPSFEAVEDVGPSMKAKVKAIYEQIAKVIRMIVAKVKAYFAYLFSDSHRLAKSFEKLGDKIRLFDYSKSQVVTLADMEGAPGGPKALIPALAALHAASLEVLHQGPAILAAQLNYLYTADKTSVYGTSSEFQVIEQISMTAARGKSLSESGDETSNPVVLSKPYLNGLQLKVQVFDNNSSGKDFFMDLIRRALLTQIGFVHSNEENTPKSSTFTLSHELAKDCYEALRPLVNSLVDHTSDSYHTVLKTVAEDGEKLDAWLHTRAQQAISANEDLRLLQLYQESVKSISGGQLTAIVRSHGLLDKTAMVVIDYLNHALKTPVIVPQKSPMAAEA